MNENTPFWIRIGADANGDGRLSLTDAREWLVNILLLPGDVFVYLLVTYAPPVADFLELSANTSGGVVSITASVLIWLAAIVITGTVLGRIRDLDRSMTAWVAARYNEAWRQIRVLRRRIVGWITLRSQRKHSDDESLIVDSLILKGLETAVLRCLSRIDDGAVLTTEEIAARVERPKRELQTALQRLAELELIKAGADKFSNRDGHCIATAGQMYLLGA